MTKFSSPFLAKSPLNNGKKIIGEDTGKIKSDKKGEYVLHKEKDTIRPPKGETQFKPFVLDKSLGKNSSGYLIGGDYKIDDEGHLVDYQ